MQQPLHIISPTEVAESLQLRDSGTQRLREISATCTTVFQFSLPYIDGVALIRINVNPVKRSDSHHPFYDVQAQYETSHPHRPIEESIIEYVQCVYNAYIQAVRWTFDLECFTRHQGLVPCEACSRTPAPLDEGQFLAVRPAQVPVLPAPEPELEEWQCIGIPKAPLVPSTTFKNVIAAAPVAKSGLRRPASRDEPDLAKRKRPKTKTRATVDEHIDTIVSIVLEGSKENAKATLVIARDIRDIIKSFINECQAATHAEDLDELLTRHAQEFGQNKAMAAREGIIKGWFSWYLSSCLHYFRYAKNVPRGDRKYDHPSRAIEVLHSIVDKLLLTDGILALSVITSFAVRGRILSDVARRDESDRQAISKGVAERLKGKLQMPNGLDIPNPIFCVGFILEKENDLKDRTVGHPQSHSYLQAYRFLNFPNLALLQLHQAAEVISFTDLQVRWTEFTTSTPEFETLHQLLQLVSNKEFSVTMLRSLRDSSALFKSGEIDQALQKLESVEEDAVEGSCVEEDEVDASLQSQEDQEDEEKQWRDLTKDFSCLLSSRLSTCIKDSLETTKVHNVAWDPIGDWSGMGTTNLPGLGADKTLDAFFDMS